MWFIVKWMVQSFGDVLNQTVVIIRLQSDTTAAVGLHKLLKQPVTSIPASSHSIPKTVAASEFEPSDSRSRSL